MQLVLIRHSKTILDKNHSNLVWQLSPEGILLAEALSSNEHIKQLNVIYTSNQTKALHTTILVAKDHFIPIRVEPDLTEATSITNGFFEDFENQIHLLHTKKGHTINEGETKEEALARFNKAIASIVAQNPTAKRIGIVSHGNVLAFFTSQFENRTSLEIHKALQMPDLAILDWDSKKLIKSFGND